MASTMASIIRRHILGKSFIKSFMCHLVSAEEVINELKSRNQLGGLYIDFQAFTLTQETLGAQQKAANTRRSSEPLKLQNTLF